MGQDTCVQTGLGIGGSEIAAVVGCHPWMTPFDLWAKKRGGLIEPPPSERMLLGQDMQDGIRRVYSRHTGRATKPLDIAYQHPERPWMRYSPDAICVDEPRGLDCKLVAFDQRWKWGATSDEVPEYIQLQCIWYMAATGLPLWDVAAFFGDRLLIYSYARDLKIEADLLEAGETFWRRYLIGDERPAITAVTANTDSWLKQAFPRNIADIRPATEAEIDLLTEYAQVRVEAKEKESEKDVLEAQLKLAVGDADGIEWPNGRFTWKRPADSIDWKAVAQDLLSAYLPDDRAAIEKRFLRENARRIYFRCDVEEAA